MLYRYTSEEGKIAYGDPNVVNDVKKFGAASMYIDGSVNQDSPQFAGHPDWDINEDYTIELWVRFQEGNVQGPLVARVQSPMNNVRYWALGVSGGNLTFLTVRHTTGDNDSLSAAYDFQPDVWYHIAFTAENVVDTVGYWRLFVNGVLIGEKQGTAIVASPLTGTGVLSSWALYLGAELRTGFPIFKGWMDDVRLTKGIARYTSNFTPPVAEFPYPSYP